jgi:hypothetical protein
MAQFVFDNIYISFENLKIALKIFLQPFWVHLKFGSFWLLTYR